MCSTDNTDVPKETEIATKCDEIIKSTDTEISHKSIKRVRSEITDD